MTVRNLVHTSLGGRGLQVTLSNAEGDRPVTFSPVAVGVQSECAAVVPESQPQFTLEGEASVTIEPGDTAQSDPLSWQVPADATLAVSVHGAFDSVVDFDEAVRDPANPVEMDPRYGDEDHLHPSDEGYTQMAEAVDLTTLDCDRA